MTLSRLCVENSYFNLSTRAQFSTLRSQWEKAWYEVFFNFHQYFYNLMFIPAMKLVPAMGK